MATFASSLTMASRRGSQTSVRPANVSPALQSLFRSFAAQVTLISFTSIFPLFTSIKGLPLRMPTVP